ncbi:MAG: hypothetical protein IPJ77_02050 [Planctomycetes bacterium]|nr:hypothetical protein [Planctomycetota bacterium]
MRPHPLAPFALLLALAACRSTDDAPPTGPYQTERDERLLYELLEPHDHEFRITYALSATTPGAKAYFTPVRGDTFVSEVHAENLDSGARLDVGLVDGAAARKAGHPGADPSGKYFAIALDAAVPEHGERRLVVRTKYEDRDSYQFHGDDLVFSRLLAAPEVRVTLPPQHALVECNVPARIARTDDGRIELSYAKHGRVPLPLRVVARRAADAPPDAGDAGEPARAPFRCEARAGLERRARLELVDAATGALAWQLDLAAEPPLAALPKVELDAAEGDLAVFARDSGAKLAPERAGEDLFLDAGAKRVRLEAAARVPGAATRSTLRLALAPAPLASLVLPAGWSPSACTAAVGVTPLPDGRTRLDFDPAAVDREDMLVELWRPRPARAEREPKSAPAVPAPSAVDLDE